ncbi:Uncharacterised protein [Serratia fonticola]|uniref:Uncharacterized protein n=1 Tax=Serratia fonticola TaxID=47917 RepID=A0A4U9U4G2_SERFO|nr:Uncharacterised protein [Serratia fonticola]
MRSQSAHHQRHGNTGEGALERHVDHLAKGAGQAVYPDPFEHHRLEATEEGVTFAERQAVAVNDPQHATPGQR